QVGTCSLRDLDLARGNVKPAEGEEPPGEAQLLAVVIALPAEELQSLAAAVNAALEAISEMESILRTRTNGAAIPNVDRLRRELLRLSELLDEQQQRTDAAPAQTSSAASAA